MGTAPLSPLKQKTWLEYWKHFAKAPVPGTCSVVGCENKVSLGAHLINEYFEYQFFIVPLCDSCNHRTDIFKLKSDKLAVSANKKDKKQHPFF